MDVSFRTPRLLLRQPVMADVPAIVAGLNDYEVVRYLTRVPHPYSDADARQWLNMLQPPTPDTAHFAIELEDGRMVGVVSIESELGYWLDRRYHGRGLMTEACIALLDWHFAARPDHCLSSGAHQGNETSLNVQRKLGFVAWPGVEMRFVRSQKREVPHVRTTLDRVDYEAARAKLRSRPWM